MMRRQFKMPATERTKQILSIALAVAERKGFDRVTAADIGQAGGIAPSLVTYHLGTVEGLRVKIVQEAVATHRLRVVAQALAVSHPDALAAPEDLRRAASHYLATVR